MHFKHFAPFNQTACLQQPYMLQWTYKSGFHEFEGAFDFDTTKRLKRKIDSFLSLQETESFKDTDADIVFLNI